MPLTLNVCDDKARWDSFVRESPQGNIFCRTCFLDALGLDIDLLLVEEQGRPQVGTVVSRCGGEPASASYPTGLYHGVLFDGGYANMPVHSRAKDALRVVEFLLGELERRYDRISLCLHPRFDDLRGFSWFHYNQPELGQYKLELRYTGLVDLTAAASFESYLASIRATRRYEYRRALAQGLTAEASRDIDTLDRLHRLTFEGQGLARTEGEIRLVRKITPAAIEDEFGELLICRDAAGEAISATVFLYHEQCAYYLLGANDPSYRDRNGGTLLFLENIRRCQHRNLLWVDVCGINSPNRGDFKTSFNAVPVPYFVATWENPARRCANVE